LDGSGNVYVADTFNNAVKEMPAGCASSSCVSTLGGGFSAPYGVAVDASGNVYVADTGNSAVKEMPAGCASSSCVTTLGGGFSFPRGVAVDASGNVYVADFFNNLVKEMPAGCASSSCVTTLGGGFSEPQGVAVDASGNVYVADYGNSAVKELNRATPPSLSFAATALGSTSSDSPQTVTVNNIGNATLNFLAIGFPDDFPEDIAAPNDCSTLGSLAAGASCTLSVDFEPKTLGPLASSVVLVDNSLNQTYAVQEIPVSGTGLSPQAITFTDSLPASANYSAGLAYTLSATGGGSGNPVVFSLVSGPATLAGSALTITGAGTIVVAANQAGNATYAPAPQVTQSITIKTASQTISFTAITGAQYAATQITLSATASSGLAVTFTSGTTSVCSVTGNTLSLLIQGTCIVHAAQAGNASWAAAPTVTQSFAVSLAPQTITFTPITGTQHAASQLTLAATATSGLTVTFTSATATVCSVSGSTLSLLIPGTCIVHAAQAGNTTYAAATTQVQSFAVTLAPQTITFTAITGKQYATTQVSLSATASSGLTVTFSSTTTTICTVAGSTLSLLTPGTCIVHAAQAGNSVYASATTAQSFAVSLDPQTITFTPITGSQYAGTQVTLTATASSGLTVTFSSTTTSICSVSGNTLSLLTAGTCVVHAAQAGNSVYASATTAQSFAVKAAL
jgi:ribosomal protein S11